MMVTTGGARRELPRLVVLAAAGRSRHRLRRRACSRWPNSVTTSSAVSASMTLVDRRHDAHAHQRLDDVGAALGHAVGELLHRDGLGDRSTSRTILACSCCMLQRALASRARGATRGEAAHALAGVLVERLGDGHLPVRRRGSSRAPAPAGFLASGRAAGALGLAGSSSSSSGLDLAGRAQRARPWRRHALTARSATSRLRFLLRLLRSVAASGSGLPAR